SCVDHAWRDIVKVCSLSFHASSMQCPPPQRASAAAAAPRGASAARPPSQRKRALAFSGLRANGVTERREIKRHGILLSVSSPACEAFPSDFGSGLSGIMGKLPCVCRAERRRQAMTTGANNGVGANAEVPAPPTDPASFELRILDPKKMRVF